MSKTQPLDHLQALAKAEVPIIHVCGSLDPWLDSQTRVVEKTYKELGGRMKVVIDEGKGHEPTAPREPKPIVEFILSLQKDAPSQASSKPRDYRFDRTMTREVLENYLSRAISMEGLLNGRGDLDDNIRMLKSTGAKFIGRSLCLWGGEAALLRNLERAKAAGRRSPRGRPGDDPPRLHLRDRDHPGRSGSRSGVGVRRVWSAGGEEEFPLCRYALSRRPPQKPMEGRQLRPGREPTRDASSGSISWRRRSSISASRRSTSAKRS